jgi:hypothetical protein
MARSSASAVAQNFALGVRRFARHAHDFADDGDFAACEGQRNLKPVPAFHADFPIQLNATGTIGKPVTCASDITPS